MFLLGVSIVTTFLFSVAETRMDVNQFLNEIEAQVQEVRSKLEKEAMWTDPAQKARLLEYLHAARVLRSEALIPVLIRRITYSPAEGLEEGLSTIKERFPVFAVLKAIGISSVPGLLNRLKLADPEDRLGNGQQEHNLIVYCLVDIYDQGGHGRELTRQRIELEAKTAVGKEREFLLKALDHYRLKP